VRKELKNRLFVALAIGVISLIALVKVETFAIYLLVIFTICMVELGLVISNRINNKILSVLATIPLLIYLTPAMLSALYLRKFFIEGLLWAILGTVANDTTAYFVGKRFGKTYFLPTISPKKTFEGTVGGIIGTVMFSLIFGLIILLIGTKILLVDLVLLGMILAVSGILGDILESRFKRYFGVKDSSHLLGAHGGLLDRLDSHLLAIPVTFAYLFWAGYIKI